MSTLIDDLGFGESGCRADVAGNGVEALTALRTTPYDAIFMDLQMPEMDGLQAARHIRTGFPAGHQPRVITLTAVATTEDGANVGKPAWTTTCPGRSE